MSLLRPLQTILRPATHFAQRPLPLVLGRLYSSVGKEQLERVGKAVHGDNIVIFMRGTPSAPKCDYSEYVVRLMGMHGVAKYSTYDIDADKDLAEAVKEYANWPTLPMVYMGGEFVGSMDLLLNMHRSGQLAARLEELGIESKYDGDE